MAASRVNRRLLGFGVMRSPNSPLKAAAPYFHDGQNDKQSPSLKLDHEEWDFPPKPKWMRWKTYRRYESRFERYDAILDTGIIELDHR